MKLWKHGVAREIPTYLSGELLDSIETAWDATGKSTDRCQLSHDELEVVDATLSRLEATSDTERVKLLDAWRVTKGPPFLLCLLSSSYEEAASHGPGYYRTRTAYECRMAGLLRLRSGAGQAVMRPETKGDKLFDVLLRRDFDLPECPEWSERYYVLASDRQGLARAVPKPALDQIATRDDLFIEIRDRDMLILWPTIVGAEAAVEACGFLSELSSTLGPEDASPYRSR